MNDDCHVAKMTRLSPSELGEFKTLPDSPPMVLLSAHIQVERDKEGMCTCTMIGTKNRQSVTARNASWFEAVILALAELG